MSSIVNRVMGISDVKEVGDNIVISGASAQALSRDVKNLWNTSKITNNMFTKVTWSQITIPRFFAIELRFILTKLLEEYSLTTPRRIIKGIIEGIETNTWVRSTLNPPAKWLDRSALKEIKFTMLKHQAEFLDIYETMKPQYNLNGYLLAAGAGSGKAQPLDCKVLTPEGFKRMGDMKIGTVVSTPDGKTGRVIAVFPQGEKDIYKVTFVDGRSTEACGEHLWAYYGAHAKPVNKLAITNTLDLKARVERNKRANRIPLARRAETHYRQMPLDPYILGLFLGDGGMRHQIIFTSPDTQLVESIAASLPDDISIKQISEYDYRISGRAGNSPNSVTDKFRELNLFDKYSYEKVIPECYLSGSRKQRLDLLQGLMDTDGYVDEQGTINFCTTSHAMAKQVQELIWSVGGIARISEKNPTFTHNGEKREGRVAYNVNIRHYKPSELFRLERKLVRCKDDGQYCDNLSLGIKSIEFVGVKEAQCISIDHPDHLYITDDYIVTHNTLNTIAVALAVKATKVIVVVPKAAVYNVWDKTLNESMVVPQKPYVADRDGVIQPDKKWHIFHYESLDRAEELATIFGMNDEKVCVILDESHNINDIKSLRTARFINVCMRSRSKDVLWASGTPIKAMGTEAIPLIKSIDPLFNNEAEDVFRKMFGKDAKRSLDILANRLGLISYKVERKTYMTDKPNEVPVNIQLPNGKEYTLEAISKKMKLFVAERAQFYLEHRGEFLASYYRITDAYAIGLRSDADKATYEEYRKQVAYLSSKKFDNMTDAAYAMATNKYEKDKIMPTLSSMDKKAFTNAKSVVKYVDLKIRGESLGQILTKERISCFRDLLHQIDFEQLINSVEKKTVIFSSYVTIVDECSEILQKKGFSPLIVYGETNHELPRIVKRFGEDPNANPLIATFQSLSTAVPLTMANGMIFLNSPWRSFEREQAIAREHRIGQDKPVFVYDIQLDTGSATNISTRSIDILQWSKDQVDRITGIEGGMNVSLEFNGLDTQFNADICDLVEDVAFEPLEDIGDMLNKGRLTQTVTVSLEK